MSSIAITLKLFRSNLKNTFMYLVTVAISVAMYYNFALLKYSPEALGGESVSTMVMMCAMLMTIVMACVFWSFVWSSSRYFLRQRKKEIGIYTLCGVPLGRIGRVFMWDALLTGLVALAVGLMLGTMFTKLFLMGAAKFMMLEIPIAFTFSWYSVIETLIIIGSAFVLVGFRNVYTVRRSVLIDLLNDMCKPEDAPKRMALRAVLSFIAIGSGYILSLLLRGKYVFYVIIVAWPVLLLVILGTYWAFQALLPMLLSRLMQNKDFIYRGMRIVGISNTWHRLRSNYRNLALTSILAATAITSLCLALGLSDYVGWRQGSEIQRQLKLYSASVWIAAAYDRELEHAFTAEGIPPSDCDWITAYSVAATGGGDNVVVIERSAAQRAINKCMDKVNLPHQELDIPEGGVLMLQNPDQMGFSIINGNMPVKIAGEEFEYKELVGVWPFATNVEIHQVYVIEDGQLAKYDASQVEQMTFVGLQLDRDHANDICLRLSGRVKDAHFKQHNMLTTSLRVEYGSMSYLALIMFGVFSMLTGCSMLFKHLSEAMNDRGMYQSMIHIGATPDELYGAVLWQVGLSLLVPIALGFVHACFAIRVAAEFFGLNMARNLLISLGIYALVTLALYIVATKKYMKIVC